MTGRKKDYINYRISRAHDTFNDAKIMADNGSWNSCVNRLYYASFYIVHALLILHNLEAKTHSGTKRLFFLEFVKKGNVSRAFGKLYSDLFEWRNEGDYADFIEFDEGFIKPIIYKTKDFIDQIEKLIITTGC